DLAQRTLDGLASGGGGAADRRRRPRSHGHGVAEPRGVPLGAAADMITALTLVALGFFLGMRHATDADHVIAVSTIVTRQRTLRGGVLIGGLWGLGHTLTIMGVGGAIIVFSLVIPPALGLTMEMTVALMLIVLGLWNLTGIIQTLRDHLGGGAGLHAHAHRHGDYVHSHRHGHGAQDHGHREDATPQAWLDRHFGGLGLYPGHAVWTPKRDGEVGRHRRARAGRPPVVERRLRSRCERLGWAVPVTRSRRDVVSREPRNVPDGRHRARGQPDRRQSPAAR